MQPSEDFFIALGYIDHNRNNVPFVVLNLFDNELLLFGDMIWGTEESHFTRGDICISKKNPTEYCKVGTWKNIGNQIELSIIGKGVFYADAINPLSYKIHYGKAKNRLEELALISIKNTKNECLK